MESRRANRGSRVCNPRDKVVNHKISNWFKQAGSGNLFADREFKFVSNDRRVSPAKGWNFYLYKSGEILITTLPKTVWLARATLSFPLLALVSLQLPEPIRIGNLLREIL
jgi:hypothetical protein